LNSGVFFWLVQKATMELTGFFLQDEITAAITAEFRAFLAQYDPEMASATIPPIQKIRDTAKGDFTLILKAACAKRKLDVNKYSADLAVALNEHFVGFVLFYAQSYIFMIRHSFI
jgi:hypothetical protein